MAGRNLERTPCEADRKRNVREISRSKRWKDSAPKISQLPGYLDRLCTRVTERGSEDFSWWKKEVFNELERNIIEVIAADVTLSGEGGLLVESGSMHSGE